MNKLSPIWKQTLQRLGLSWKSILLTHLAFTGLGVILFVPMLGLASRLLLKLSGQVALADQDIAYFLLSPAGLIGMILFSGLIIAVLTFEQAAIMYIALGTKKGKQIEPLDALSFTATQAHKLWLFTVRLVIRILVIALPLLTLAALIAWHLITDYDINFYLSQKPPEFWVAAALIGGVLIVLLLLLAKKLSQWCLALPLVLFARISPADSFAESARLIEGQRKLVFGVLLSWAGLSLALGFSVLGSIKLLGHFSIPVFSESLALLVILLGGLAALWSVSNVLITVLTAATFAYLLIALYEVSGGEFRVNQNTTKDTRISGAIRRFMPKSIATAILLAAIVAGGAGLWLINGIPTHNEIIIVAHRGAAGKAPENTLAAFEQAINDQTDWIELDVQESAEGEIIVMHDSDFMKLAANPVKTWEVTKEDIQDIDIGSWYHADFAAERTPTLKQVLKLSRDKARVVIELKYYGHDESLEQRVIDIVEATEMVDQTAIMSLKYNAIKKVRALRPDWKLGLLSATAIGDLSQLDTDFLAVAMNMASLGFVKRAHKAGKQVYVWTVNDPLSVSRMISLGVDGIITDEPEMARNVMNERAQLSTIERLLLHTAQLFGEPYIPNQYRDNSP